MIAAAWVLFSYGLSWRIYLALMSIPCFAAGILALFMPESPRYLLSIGENEKVENVIYLMSRINGRDLNTIGNSLLPHAHTDPNTRGNVVNLFLPSYRYTTFLIFIALSNNVYIFNGPQSNFFSKNNQDALESDIFILFLHFHHSN